MIHGVIYNLISKTLFIVGAYIIHVYVGRILGPEQYGTFGVVLSILTISYIFLNNGVRQTLSKQIAAAPATAKSLFFKGCFIQSIVALLVAFLISGSANFLSVFFSDSSLAVPLWICGAVVYVQGLFFVCTGTLNGLKSFLFENILMSIYSVSRPLFVILFICFGWGVSGAVFGFLAASACATVVGLTGILKKDGGSANIRKRNLLLPVLTNIIIFACIAGLMNFDVLFIKKIISDARFTGFYTAASAFAKPVYWLLLSFGAVALPLVAASYSSRDIPQCRKYFSQVIRYAVMMFLPVTVIIAATAKELIIFFYSPVYAPAGMALAILSFGIFLIGLFGILAHVMIAIAKEKQAAILSVGIIIINLILNYTLIPVFGIAGAAMATLISAVLLTACSGWIVVRTVGIDLQLRSLFRIPALLVLLYYFSGSGITEAVSLPLAYIILYGLFSAGLLISGEISKQDLDVIKGIVIKRKP